MAGITHSALPPKKPDPGGCVAALLLQPNPPPINLSLSVYVSINLSIR